MLSLVIPRMAVAILSIIVAITGASFQTSYLSDLWWVLGGSAVSWALLAMWVRTKRMYVSSGLSTGWRWAKGVVQLAIVAFVAFLLAVVLFLPDKGIHFAGILVTLYANYQVRAWSDGWAVGWNGSNDLTAAAPRTRARVPASSGVIAPSCC